jgi:enoyl-CoA hydratase/carnithine racemase
VCICLGDHKNGAKPFGGRNRHRMAQPLVTFERDGDVALIGLKRAAKRNAINDAMIEALAEAVARASAEAKAAVLFGHGDHFCAGLDLAEHVDKDMVASIHGSRRWHAVFDNIQRGAIPFVAALHGAVVGGGLELAASAHIRVADTTAFFALPEGQRGIFVGGGGSVRVAALMSAAGMMDLMLTGRVLTAQEAEGRNLAQYIVPKGDAAAKAVALASAAATNAPLSNYAIINALPRIQDMAHDDGLFVESMVSAMTSASPQARARLDDFINKRATRLAVPGREET